MLLGVSGLFDCKNKNKIFIGCLLAVLLKETSHILSGCIYFAEYAWDGWNPIAYSIVYNLFYASELETAFTSKLALFLVESPS